MDIARWAPEGAWTVYEAENNWEKLKGLAAGGASMELDLRSVTEFDTTGLQMLIMAQRLGRQIGGGLRLVGCSEAVRESLRLYGYGRGAGGEESAEVVCP